MTGLVPFCSDPSVPGNLAKKISPRLMICIDEEQADSMLQDGYDVFHVAAVLEVSVPLLNIKLLEMSTMGYDFSNAYWGDTRPFD